ncbi:hypothetical protein LTR56_022270, partial [Elasticomyces elasticus]
MSKGTSAATGASPMDGEKSLQHSIIPIKWQDTAADCHDMSVLGKKQVLRRQFRFWTILGFASKVMVAWEFCLLVSPFTLQDGGTAGIFRGLIYRLKDM